MNFHDLVQSGIKLLLYIAKDPIRVIDSPDLVSGRNRNDSNPVDLFKFRHIIDTRPRHSCLLRELIKEILIGDGCHGAAFHGDLDILLGFQRLVLPAP